MEEWDIEDFVEEVKFMLTEYDEMTKEMILDWERMFRDWVDNHSNHKNIKIKAKDEIYILIKDENIFYNLALKYHNAYRKDNVSSYWDKLEFK